MGNTMIIPDPGVGFACRITFAKKEENNRQSTRPAIKKTSIFCGLREGLTHHYFKSILSSFYGKTFLFSIPSWGVGERSELRGGVGRSLGFWHSVQSFVSRIQNYLIEQLLYFEGSFAHKVPQSPSWLRQFCIQMSHRQRNRFYGRLFELEEECQNISQRMTSDVVGATSLPYALPPS